EISGRAGTVADFVRAPNGHNLALITKAPGHYRYLGRTVAKQARDSTLTLREWLWLNGTGN
ncbi:MAG: hypothetical protein ABIZ57_10515, partial [Candidatus Limnocylindria bacterium]